MAKKQATPTKRYELVEDDTVTTWDGRTLFRIRALVAIGLSVAVGDLGGYVEKEENLSQVSGDAWVSGNARVYGNAQVSGDARVSGDAWVYGDAQVSGDAWVYGNARVYGNAQVSGDARVSGDAWVSGNARVYGNAQVSGDARVYGNARVSGNARVYGNAWVYGNARVSGNAWVYGRNHLGWFSCVGSENGTLCWFLQKDRSVKVARGCFSGSLDQFREAVEQRHGDSPHGQQYRLLIQFIELRAAEALKDYAPVEEPAQPEAARTAA